MIKHIGTKLTHLDLTSGRSRNVILQTMCAVQQQFRILQLIVKYTVYISPVMSGILHDILLK